MRRMIYYLLVLCTFLFMAFYSILVIRNAGIRIQEFSKYEQELGIIDHVDRSIDKR
jgi:hypothetical protein